MRLLFGILSFFKLPLQLIIAAYISFVLIAITIAVSHHHGFDKHIVEAQNETRRNPV